MNRAYEISKKRIRLTQISCIIITLLFMIVFGNRYILQPYISFESKNKKDTILYEAVSTYANEGSFIDRNGTIISENNIVNTPENYSYAWLLGYYSVSYGNENKFGLRGSLKDYIYFLLDDDNNGADIHLTIDSRIQNYAYENILNNLEGSAIVLNNKTGEILAFASKSVIDYDANEATAILNSDIPNSQFRRGTYENDPPGSTFKVITSIAALEKAKEENLGEDFFYYYDNGSYIPEGDSFVITNYGNAMYGDIDLNEAMKYSVNCYFANLGIKVGKDRIIDVAERFMIGKDIEIPFLDTITSSLNAEDLSIADVAQLAFGQGKTEVTPFNLALIAEAIGNNGIMKKPYLVESIRYKNLPLYQANDSDLSKCASEDIILKLKEAMHEAAVGYGLNENYGMVYAKTGTAECADDRLHTYIMVTTDDFSFVISRNNGDASTELYGYAVSLLAYIQSLNINY